MDYIPGEIHEKVQQLHVFQVLNNFVIPVLNKRWNDTSFIMEDDSTFSIDLNIGDLLFVRYFKPNTSSTLYTFLEKVIRGEGEIEVMGETVVSCDFIMMNSDPHGVIFSDVTQQYERDKKIEKILK